METKLGKIQEFMDSMKAEEISESEQALLLNGDNFGGANESACHNWNDCTGSSNKSGCMNHKVC